MAAVLCAARENRRHRSNSRGVRASIEWLYKHLVVGTGGSSLGARTLCSLAPNTTPKLHFLENVDPSELDPFFDQLDPANERFIRLQVRRHAGNLGCFHGIYELLREGCGEAALGRHTMAITEQNDNPLARLCDRYGIPVMPHNPDIGGRYSIFSAVGMLPATLAGLDASAIRDGATSVLTSGAPVDGAALAAAMAAEKQHASSVLMPYRDQLSTLALWYRQLWAESLGKDGKGTTPIQASGAVDQHSQLQLYLDGPNDKLISLVTCPATGTGTTIPGNLAQEAGMPEIGGRPIGDLLDALSRRPMLSKRLAGQYGFSRPSGWMKRLLAP